MRMKNVYWEILALLSLRYLWDDYVPHFIKGEKPDWHNKVDSIGLEVSRAISKKAGRIEHFNSMYLGKQADQIPIKDQIQFEGLSFVKDGRLIATADAKGLSDTRSYFDELIKRYEDKLGKFSNYSKFRTNCFFFFLSFVPNDFDLSQILSSMRTIDHENRESVDLIFILTQMQLYVVDKRMFIKQAFLVPPDLMTRMIREAKLISSDHDDNKVGWSFEEEYLRKTIRD